MTVTYTPPDPDCPMCRAAGPMSVAFALTPPTECTHRMSADVPHIPVYKVRDFVPFTFGPEETP